MKKIKINTQIKMRKVKMNKIVINYKIQDKMIE